MSTYVGTRTNEGTLPVYSVTVTSAITTYELPVHAHWSQGRSWDNEYGIRQLALDLLLDHFDEHPTPTQLLAKEDSARAWFPHLGYFRELTRFATPGRIADQWVITDQQLNTWVDDWAIGKHRKFAQSKYGDAYSGEPFDVWLNRLSELLQRNGAVSLSDIGIIDIWAWKAYLSGYQSSHIAYLWACDRNAHLRRCLYSNAPVTLSSIWAEIPEREFQ